MAELMLNHSSYNECKDVDTFKKELGALVNTFREEALCLNNVSLFLSEKKSDLYQFLNNTRLRQCYKEFFFSFCSYV